MPAYKDKRSGRWRYRKRVTLPDGKYARVEGTPATNTKSAAEHAERAHVFRRMNPSTVRVSGAVPTLGEYKETFLAHYVAGKQGDVDSKKQILNAYLDKRMGGQRLDTIVQSDVDGLVESLLKKKLAPKTINNILSVLASLLRFAARNRVIERVDADFFLKSESAELVAVQPADVEALLRVACPRYRAAILLACDAGLRAGEVRALRWTDLNELRRELTVRRSLDTKGRPTAPKNWKERPVPVSDRLWEAIRALPEQGETIITLKTSGKPMSYWGLRDGIVALYGKAEVTKPPMPWHCLRHSFCTGLADAGVQINVIKELAGHSSITTTLRYMHTGANARADAIGKAFGRQVGDSHSEKEKTPAKQLTYPGFPKRPQRDLKT